MLKIIPAIFRKSIINPLAALLHDSRSIGIILLSCTVISLVITNTSLGAGYMGFWHTEIPFFHSLLLPHSFLHFINDGFMAAFFFLAGMEIKREMAEGELSTTKKARLPVVAAVGGMVAPAVLYYMFNTGTSAQHGWGIPMATDIAFALGVASLLGKRVPVSLKIFLTALAIIDDLGAILVIAIFYGGSINLLYLAGCTVIIIILWLVTKPNKPFGIIHFALGLLLWFCMFNSGIHATIAGVIFAFLVPVPMLKKVENRLHPFVYFIIMPIFALANTAIIFPADGVRQISSNLSLGIISGLVIGKPLGICIACYILIKSKLADFPSGVQWKHLIGAGMLAGIGFTMSIFISSLAFSNAATQDTAKIAVLTASLLSIIAGFAWLKYISGKHS